LVIPDSCRRSRAGGIFTNQEPDYLLTDIHRQAKDNPIIQLAMHVREGREIMHGDWGTAQVISKNDVTQDLVMKADQVLVGTNKTRRRYNKRLRELKGFTMDYRLATSSSACAMIRQKGCSTDRSGR
jgi:exodeoxyribonuclease-5